MLNNLKLCANQPKFIKRWSFIDIPKAEKTPSPSPLPAGERGNLLK